MPRLLLLAFLILSRQVWAAAEVAAVTATTPAAANASQPTPILTEPETLLSKAPPYAPRKTDYSFESGLMNNRDDLFWNGLIMGFHVGRCMFTASDSCQQYLDGHLSVAAREGETQGHYWASVRWQYVNLPDRYSTYWRLLGGAATVARAGSDRLWSPVIGGGIGVVTYLHEKVDLRLEVRALAIDRGYIQAVAGVNIKVDRLLSVFAQKLKAIGYGTVETAIDATGTAIKATGEGIGGVINGVSDPFRNKEKKVEPTPAPK